MEAEEESIAKTEIMEETKTKIRGIREHLRMAQLLQQQYANKKRKPLDFKVGDMVMLKVSSLKAIIHFCKKGKLTPRYIGPFQIL